MVDMLHALNCVQSNGETLGLRSLGTGRNPKESFVEWPLGAPTLWLSWLATFSTALSFSWSCGVVVEQISTRVREHSMT